MKKLFNAVADKVSPFRTFKYEEGNRSAIVEYKRFPFVQTINSEYWTHGAFSQFKPDNQIIIGIGLNKQELEEKKQKARKFCKTGLV